MIGEFCSTCLPIKPNSREAIAAKMPMIYWEKTSLDKVDFLENRSPF